MIEIAPEEYHIMCSYADAMMYCFFLNIDGKNGWRLPTYKEKKSTMMDYNITWYENDPYGTKIPIYRIIPVRDI
jgi:hypothetical protein